MATPIDLPQSPLPRPAALVLAEAALQRQNSLLGATGATPSPGAAAGPAPGGDPPAVPLASPPPLQDRLSLSPEARQRLAAEVTAQALPGAAPPAGTAPKPVVPTGAPPGVPLPNPLPNPVPSLAADTAPPSLLPVAPGTALPMPTSSAAAAPPLPVATALATTPLASPVAAPAPALPAMGVRPVVQQLVQSLLQQLAPPQLPLQAVRIQPWTPALVQWLEAASAPAPSASAASAQGAAPLPLDEGLPPLQTWLVHQGVVQTPDGPRGFALTLRLPLAWVEAQPPATPATPAPTAATPMAMAGSPVAAPLVFADRAQALPSIPLALVLQNAASEGPAARTSALLVLEFQPLAQASVYGRELATPRLDPWVQMALLQASGQLAVEEEQARRRAEALCDTPGCPYLGRATCVQPFCSAMRAVIPVVPVLDRGETGPASSRPAPPLPASSPQSGKTKD